MEPAVRSAGLSVSAALAARHSSRAFLPDPVEPEMLEDILRRAAQAPSGGNLQPWRVRLLTGDALAALTARVTARAEALPEGEPMPFPFYPEPDSATGQQRRQAAGAQLYQALGIAREDSAARRAWLLENFAFFGAPAGVLIFVEAGATPFQWLDLGIYLQSVLLLLTEAGLAACAQADWAMYAPTVAAALNLPAGLQLACGIAIGHADPARPINAVRTTRDDPLSLP